MGFPSKGSVTSSIHPNSYLAAISGLENLYLEVAKARLLEFRVFFSKVRFRPTSFSYSK